MFFSRLLLAAFEFISLPMLGWLAAGALPWLIYRWNRRQHRTTSWAAVDLLLTAVSRSSRQVKLRQWLLIAVRTAIVVLVALAVAEPVIRRWARGSGGIGRSHTVIVLDQSYSMGLRSSNSSRLDRAKAEARQLVESRRRGDVFSVVGWTKSTDNILGRPTADPSLVLSAIGSLSQSEETADLSVAFRAVQAALKRAENEVPHLDHSNVVFLSDLSQNTWQVGPEVQSQLEGLAKQSRLTVIHVGDDERNNVAVVDLTIEPTLLSRGQKVSFSATLQGFGDKAWEDIEVELSVDGRFVESQQTSLSEGGVAAVRFDHQFDGEGSHTVLVSVAGEVDSLPIDNRRWLVVEVRPQLRVACIAGRPRAADDVARALAPGSQSDDFMQTIRPEIFSGGRLSELDLKHYDAVFLCSVSDLNQHEADRLARFVQSGGGLTVLLDGQVLTEPMGHLLPVIVHEAVPIGEYHFDALEYAHPIVEPFRGNENAGLLKVAVMKYRRLTVKQECRSAETVLAFGTGDPALVVDRRGLGRVAVMAVPCSLTIRTEEKSPWSSFAMSPSYLPVMRELFAYLGSARWLEGQNLQVDQTATCRWDMSRPETQVAVRMPDGSEQVLTTQAVENQGMILLTDTSQSGIYQVSTAGEQIARFAVNLDPRESDLASLDVNDLPAIVATGSASSSVEVRTATSDYSFAPSLLACAAVLLLAELALACWLGRGWQ